MLFSSMAYIKARSITIILCQLLKIPTIIIVDYTVLPIQYLYKIILLNLCDCATIAYNILTDGYCGGLENLCLTYIT